jgi:hypothetical protein
MSSSIRLPSLPDSDAESDHSTRSLILPLALEQDPTWTDQYRTTEQRRRHIFWDYPLDALKALKVPDTPTKDIWAPSEHSQTTLTRLFAHIKTDPRKIDDYKLLFAFQKTENGFIVMTGALQRTVSADGKRKVRCWRSNGKRNLRWHAGDIVMMTTTTKPRAEITQGKPTPSHAEGWTVYGTHIIAPPCFWRAFKAC